VGGLDALLSEDRLEHRRHHGPLGRPDMREEVPGEVHDPNAIDVLRFSRSLPFAWPAIARPRRLPAR
jgi:hypothetical protein